MSCWTDSDTYHAEIKDGSTRIEAHVEVKAGSGDCDYTRAKVQDAFDAFIKAISE